MDSPYLGESKRKWHSIGVCLSVCLSLCLSVCLSFFLSFFLLSYFVSSFLSLFLAFLKPFLNSFSTSPSTTLHSSGLSPSFLLPSDFSFLPSFFSFRKRKSLPISQSRVFGNVSVSYLLLNLKALFCQIHCQLIRKVQTQTFSLKKKQKKKTTWY